MSFIIIIFITTIIIFREKPLRDHEILAIFLAEDPREEEDNIFSIGDNEQIEVSAHDSDSEQ